MVYDIWFLKIPNLMELKIIINFYYWRRLIQVCDMEFKLGGLSSSARDVFLSNTAILVLLAGQVTHGACLGKVLSRELTHTWAVSCGNLPSNLEMSGTSGKECNTEFKSGCSIGSVSVREARDKRFDFWLRLHVFPKTFKSIRFFLQVPK